MAEKRKEAGVIYAARCLACRDEIALGWLPTQAPVPWVQTQLEDLRTPWPRLRPDGAFSGPVSCRCGEVTLARLVDGERAVVTWRGAQEPMLRVFPQYGSVRDLATGG